MGNLTKALLLAVAISVWAAVPAEADLEDLIFTTQLLGVPTLGFEIAWGMSPHWLVHAGVPVRIESESGSTPLKLWGRGVLLYRLFPLPWLTAYGGLGLTLGMAFEDGLSLSPFYEVPFGVQLPLWGDFDALAEVRIGLTDLLTSPKESLRFITLAIGIAFAMR